MGPLLIGATLAALASAFGAEVELDRATKRLYLRVALARLAQKARELFGRQMSPIIREIEKRFSERLFRATVAFSAAARTVLLLSHHHHRRHRHQGAAGQRIPTVEGMQRLANRPRGRIRFSTNRLVSVANEPSSVNHLSGSRAGVVGIKPKEMHHSEVDDNKTLLKVVNEIVHVHETREQIEFSEQTPLLDN